MRFHVITYKKTQPLADLCKSMDNIFQLGEVKDLSMIENPYNSEIVFRITLDVNEKPKHKGFVSIGPADSMIQDMNIQLQSLEKDGRTVKAINYLPLGGSRAIGVIVAEVEQKHETVNQERKVRAGTKNKKANVKPDAGAEG